MYIINYIIINYTVYNYTMYLIIFIYLYDIFKETEFRS